MATKNAIQESYEPLEGIIDFDELERTLENDLNSQLSDLDFLIKDREKINNPESLGDTVREVIWEQFLNQIAVTAGEDFIQENRGLTLDLRNEAHIQTTENFANGKIATHNNRIDYQQRYDDWQDNFQRDANGNIKMKWDSRSGTYKEVLKEGARRDFDKGRPKGKNSNHTNMDHTISAGEMIRDPAVNAHMTRQEQVAFAISEKNLNLMDSAANQSKGDSAMTEWLNFERDGKKPAERFNIDESDLRKKDKLARKEKRKRIEDGQKIAMKTGRQSQREEAFRITGKALQAVVMQMLAELVKTIITKLVAWMKSGQKNLESFISQIKVAISSFVSDMKKHILNVGDTLVTTIATAIWGPIVRTIKRVFTLLKQGAKSIREAIDYIKDPRNKNKPVGVLMLEIGKIVMAGVSAAGAMILGELIEKALMAIPVFAVEIPLFGSLASILGIFMGALVSGIIGALAIRLIDNAVAKKQLSENTKMQISKRNEILNTQNEMSVLQQGKLKAVKYEINTTIRERHQAAGEIIRDALKNIYRDDNGFEEIGHNGEIYEESCYDDEIYEENGYDDEIYEENGYDDEIYDDDNENQVKFDKIYQLLHDW